MATQAQLEAEPWWGQEYAPPSLVALRSRLLAFWGISGGAIGIKGDADHLTGRHRSRDWVLNSAYCTDRTYGTQDARDRRGDGRWLRAVDISLPPSLLYPMCRRLDTAVRAGRLPQVAEWFGTFDGRTVVGWFQGRPSTSDTSHLWHGHVGLWTDNADDDHTRLYEILTGDDMQLTDAVPSAATPDVPTRNVDQVLGDLWRGVHLRMTAELAAIRTQLEDGRTVALTDAQLEVLADKVAARLGRGTINLSGTLEPGAQA